MLVRSVSLDLLSNVFVEMSEPFVRHLFYTHNQPLFNTTPLFLASITGC